MYDDELTAQGGGMGWYGMVWYGIVWDGNVDGVRRRSWAGHKSYVERTEQPSKQPTSQRASGRATTAKAKAKATDGCNLKRSKGRLRGGGMAAGVLATDGGYDYPGFGQVAVVVMARSKRTKGNGNDDKDVDKEQKHAHTDTHPYRGTYTLNVGI